MNTTRITPRIGTKSPRKAAVTAVTSPATIGGDTSRT